MEYSKDDIKTIVESQLRVTIDEGSIVAESFSTFIGLDGIPAEFSRPADAPNGRNYKTNFPNNKVYFGTLVFSAYRVANYAIGINLQNSIVVSASNEVDVTRNPLTYFSYPMLFQNFNYSSNVFVQFTGYAITIP